MTTRPASLPVNPYAPVRAIQTKFNAILQETETSQKETNEANRERARVEQHLQQLRQKQKELSNQSRIAQEAMGGFHRERAMLLNEQARLQKVLKDERQALEQCCAENDKLASEDTARKEAYCKAMIDANQELSNLLLNQEELRLRNLITVETVSALLAAFAHSSPESDGGLKLEDAVEALKKATDDYRKTLEDEKRLQKQVKSLRARALAKSSSKDSSQQKLTEADLLELEKVWEMNWNDDEEGAATEPVQMQLFYGAKQNVADTSLESNALEAGSDVPMN